MNQTEKSTFTKKKALRIVFAAAILLCVLILLKGCSGGEDLSTFAGRQAFLLDLGWQIDPDSEDMRQVQLPEKLDGAFAKYNEIQLEQGYDLSKHLGEQCRQFSYLVTNYPNDSQTVLATLYVQGGRIIAGDIHSTALDGFLHGLKTE